MKVCSQCQKPHQSTFALCDPCRIYIREYVKARRTDRTLCVDCSEAPAENQRRCDKHRQADNQRARASKRQLKQQVFTAYGGACACCGDTTPEFLSLDHVGGGGTAHRRFRGGNNAIVYKDVIAQGFPLTFRVLCLNCNLSRGYYGYCPHETTKAQGSGTIRSDPREVGTS